MFNFYYGKYFEIEIKIQVIDSKLFEEGKYNNGDILTSNRIACDSFKEIFKKDIWNCIEYKSTADHMLDEYSTYIFTFNMRPIVKELEEFIINKFLPDIEPIKKASKLALSCSSSGAIEYDGKSICGITIEFLPKCVLSPKNRVLCVKQKYKEDLKVPISLEIYNLNKIIADINGSKNICSSEKDYGYQIKDPDNKIVYQVILDFGKFNTGVKLIGE